ncbi:hypothetical protein I3679_021540 [Proteus mirabilis]|uniref:Uncharacterized protein n=1 Tax=Proteus mirabilis TaxID=584 RepID=A0ABD5M166_PROMI
MLSIKKTVLFSGLAIEPKSLLTIGAYDLTVSGSELSHVRRTEITIDKFIADAININYGDLVNVVFIHNNEKWYYQLMYVVFLTHK